MAATYPDDLIDPTPEPERVAESREAVSLAFVRAMQALPPRQRAVPLLRDVLAFRAFEVATIPNTTEESVTSALKRSVEAPPPSHSAQERQPVEAWLDALSAFDVPRMVALLTDDVWLRMPPLDMEYFGPQAASRFFTALHSSGRQFRFEHTWANCQPHTPFINSTRSPAFGTPEDCSSSLWRAPGSGRSPGSRPACSPGSVCLARLRTEPSAGVSWASGTCLAIDQGWRPRVVPCVVIDFTIVVVDGHP